MTKREMIYTRSERIEEQVAHCYFLLHEHFIANPPLAKFWAEAAMDELQHHSMLRFCRERGLMADPEIGFDTIETVEDLLDTVKGIANDPDVSIEEAFYASLLIEASELDEIYEKLTGSLAVTHPLLYQAIHANVRGHHQSFFEGAEQFCKDRGCVEAFKNLGKTASS